MDERWPWMDWHPDERDERAVLEVEDGSMEECWECGRFVGPVGRLTCPGCGDDPV